MREIRFLEPYNLVLSRVLKPNLNSLTFCHKDTTDVNFTDTILPFFVIQKALCKVFINCHETVVHAEMDLVKKKYTDGEFNMSCILQQWYIKFVFHTHIDWWVKSTWDIIIRDQTIYIENYILNNTAKSEMFRSLLKFHELAILA